MLAVPDAMNITCERCRAQYDIPDAKIPASGFKMTCPACSHQLVVAAAGSAPAPSPPPAGPREIALSSMDDGVDLPAPVKEAAPTPLVPAASGLADVDFAMLATPDADDAEADLPAPVAPRGATGAGRSASASSASGVASIAKSTSARPEAAGTSGVGAASFTGAGRSTPSSMDESAISRGPAGGGDGAGALPAAATTSWWEQAGQVILNPDAGIFASGMSYCARQRSQVMFMASGTASISRPLHRDLDATPVLLL